MRLAFTAITLSAARIGIVPMTKARIARTRRDHRSQVRRFIAAHIKGPREQSKTASGKWRSPNGRAKLESANDRRRAALRTPRFRGTFGEPLACQSQIRIERERLFEGSNGTLMLTE